MMSLGNDNNILGNTKCVIVNNSFCNIYDETNIDMCNIYKLSLRSKKVLQLLDYFGIDCRGKFLLTEIN